MPYCCLCSIHVFSFAHTSFPYCCPPLHTYHLDDDVIHNPIDSMQSTMSSLLTIFLLVLYCIFYRQDFAFYVMIRSLPGGYILCVMFTCIRSFFQPRLKHVTDGGGAS